MQFHAARNQAMQFCAARNQTNQWRHRNETVTKRLGCFGKLVLESELSVPAVSATAYRLNADINRISYLYILHIFHGRLTFEKLPYPNNGITVIRKLLSYTLVTHMSRIEQTCFIKYHMRFSLSRTNWHPNHLQVYTLKYTKLTYSISNRSSKWCLI